jgi:hypothetical protein
MMRWTQSAAFASCRSAERNLEPEALRESIIGIAATGVSPRPEQEQRLRRKPQSLAAALGIVEPLPPSDAAGHLETQVRGRNALLKELLRDAETVHDEWQLAVTSQSALEVADALHEVLSALEVADILASFMRLVLVARMLDTQLSVQWSEIGLPQLRRMSPDVRDCLDALPAAWSAEDVGNFIFDRPSGGVLVSLMASLWSEVVNSQHADEELPSLLSTPDNHLIAASLGTKLGVPPSPMVWVEALRPPVSGPSSRKRRRD